MIDADDLITLVHNYNPKSNAALLRQAYEFGAAAHEGQKRHSGEPYFTHPVAVAAILAEMQLDDATIVTALFTDGTAYLGHVGDSRVYRVRNGAIEQLTEPAGVIDVDVVSARDGQRRVVEARLGGEAFQPAVAVLGHRHRKPACP